MHWTPDDILVRAVGAVAVAGLDATADHALGQLVPQFGNADLVDWAVIAADLFDVLHDGTPAGQALNAAADGAMYGLFSRLARARFALSALNPFDTAVVGTPVAPAAPTAPTATHAAASATSAPLTTPIPAASMSAVGDVALAGY
jgi:hypothetical protein